MKWFKEVEKNRKTKFKINLFYKEGDCRSGNPYVYYRSFSKLVDLETIYLQLIGPSSVAAYNAYIMCRDMPKTSFWPWMQDIVQELACMIYGIW